ncbi:hypothetical protein ACFO0N_16010 [Halobium salinum]|uniref:Uncharacterized protein n=1 Tax=Halobium salinum TaxID=1364940 RepID=A0ABD5PFE8_9EURY|nr:hypothetical protein [Halobium salinum]
MSLNSLPTGTVSESGADRTRPVGRPGERDPNPRTGTPGPPSAGRPPTEAVAELRDTVDALERELDRREAERQELVDRYERLLAMQKRDRSQARAGSEVKQALGARVVERVRTLLGR